MMPSKNLIDYLRIHYPNTDNKELAEKLNIPLSSLRTYASKYKIKKSDAFRKELSHRFHEGRKKQYLESIPKIRLNEIEENIIIGSLLGDGSIDPGPKRSINACYTEHFSPKQLAYRQWKQQKLQRLQFKIYRDRYFNSPSHPIFTDLRKLFYRDNRKILTKDILLKLTHPIGLTCLYLDDGSLLISHNNRRSNKYYIQPEITLSTFCFTKEENQLLIQHISETFGVSFKLKKHPHGHGYRIRITNLGEISKFIEIVSPYVKEIPDMAYKINLHERILEKEVTLRKMYPDSDVILPRFSHPRHFYTDDEIELLKELKRQGDSYEVIARKLERSYYSVVDKLRRME